MDKAKELKLKNQEVIVDAKEIKNRYYKSVSSKEKRFICLCCGEYLSYVISDKKKPYFRHINENETTKKCQMRISYDSEQTVYQKAGLSLYLKESGNEFFELYIAFRKIDNKIFNSLLESKEKIIIKYRNKSCEYILNNYNFSHEYTTLKKIDFIAEKYQILYPNFDLKKFLIEVWGEEIEGFLGNESLFTFDDKGGKKVKINEEIKINTEYYYLGSNERIFKNYNNIKVVYKGILEVNNSEYYLSQYKIYKISFIPVNDDEFMKMRVLCRERFRVSLHYNKPNFIGLWPPTVIKNESYKVINFKNEAIGIIKSDKLEKLYCNDKHTVYEIRLKELLDDKYIIRIPIRNYEIPFILQEQYNSIFFVNGGYLDKIKQYENKIVIEDNNGMKIENGIKNKLPLKQCISITSKSKCKIIHKSQNGLVIKKINNYSKIKLENVKFGDAIISFYSGKEEILLQYLKQHKDSNKLLINQLHNKNKNDKSELVDFPIYIKNKLLKSNEYFEIYKIIKIYIFKGKIPIQILKLIEKHFNSKR